MGKNYRATHRAYERTGQNIICPVPSRVPGTKHGFPSGVIRGVKRASHYPATTRYQDLFSLFHTAHSPNSHKHPVKGTVFKDGETEALEVTQPAQRCKGT